MTLDRGKTTVLVEPYAPNIVRVSLSLRKDDALAAPGYGFVAKPMEEGWTIAERKVRRCAAILPHGGNGSASEPSGRTVCPETAKFFNGSTPGVGLSIKTPEGASILEMHGWQMSVPNHKDGNAGHPLRSPPHRSAVLSGGRHLCLAAR